MHSRLDELLETRHAGCDELDDYLQTLPDLKAQTDVLEHTVPGPDGTLLQHKGTDPHVLFNHARPPNARHYNHYYTDAEWDTIALKDIQPGEELCIDYDHSSGYESDHYAGQPHVAEYLILLDRYGVEKRPSVLTLPPVKFVVGE